jgi:hypothetical protein
VGLSRQQVSHGGAGGMLENMTDIGLPDRYILTLLELNGVPWKGVSFPRDPSPGDQLLIKIEPIHDNPNGVRTEEVIVTSAEFHEIRTNSPHDAPNIFSDLSGAPGASAGEVTIRTVLIEKIRRQQASRIACGQQTVDGTGSFRCWRPTGHTCAHQGRAAASRFLQKEWSRQDSDTCAPETNL